MLVLSDRVGGDRTVGGPSHDDADLRQERQPSFEHAVDAVESSPGPPEAVMVIDCPLTLAVVAAPVRLQETRQTVIAGELLGTVDPDPEHRGIHPGEGSDRHPDRGEELLLEAAVLGDADRHRRGRHPHRARQHRHGLSRWVLELGGDHRAHLRQPRERLRVVVVGDEMLIGHRPGRGLRVGLEHDRPEAHHPGGHQRVTAELTASEHPDRRWRRDRGLVLKNI